MSGGNAWDTCRTTLGMVARQDHDTSNFEYPHVAALARQDRTEMQRLLSLKANPERMLEERQRASGSIRIAWSSG
jgi:hypothetical protein